MKGAGRTEDSGRARRVLLVGVLVVVSAVATVAALLWLGPLRPHRSHSSSHGHGRAAGGRRASRSSRRGRPSAAAVDEPATGVSAGAEGNTLVELHHALRGDASIVSLHESWRARIRPPLTLRRFNATLNPWYSRMKVVHQGSVWPPGSTLFTGWIVCTDRKRCFGGYERSGMLIMNDKGAVVGGFETKWGKRVWAPRLINATTVAALLTVEKGGGMDFNNKLSFPVLFDLTTFRETVVPLPPVKLNGRKTNLHHDVEWNPVRGTFLVVVMVVYGGGMLPSHLLEVATNGSVLWELKRGQWADDAVMQRRRATCDAAKAKGMYVYRLMTKWTCNYNLLDDHVNSMYWDAVNNVIVFNSFQLGTFFMVEYPSGQGAVLQPPHWASLHSVRMLDSHGTFLFHLNAPFSGDKRELGALKKGFIQNGVVIVRVDPPAGVARVLWMWLSHDVQSYSGGDATPVPGDVFMQATMRERSRSLIYVQRKANTTLPSGFVGIGPNIAEAGGDVLWEFTGDFCLYRAERVVTRPTAMVCGVHDGGTCPKLDNAPPRWGEPEEWCRMKKPPCGAGSSGCHLTALVWDMHMARAPTIGYVALLGEDGHPLEAMEVRMNAHRLGTFVCLRIPRLGRGEHQMRFLVVGESGISEEVPVRLEL